MQSRFIVFGCKQDLLIEFQTDNLDYALELADGNSDAGYKARIWDNRARQFLY